MSKICVFWKKEKKTAHLECFVFNFHDFPTVVDYSCTELFSREICEQDLCFVEEREEHIRSLLFTVRFSSNCRGSCEGEKQQTKKFVLFIWGILGERRGSRNKERGRLL